MNGYEHIGRFLLNSHAYKTEPQWALLAGLADPGLHSIVSEEVGGWRHFWISDWDDPSEKADAPAVLAVHAAAGRLFNSQWL